ncbi:MAG TPA: GNAT family N-acetyltransferase [Ktedonobacterales bacterium]|nr:GNAT family N-acetyltransferase [Ktedonobacterales bacterium]
MPFASTTISALGGAAAPSEHRIAQTLALLQDGLGEGYITREALLRFVASAAELAATSAAREPFQRALVATDDATEEVVAALLVEVLAAEALRASFLESYELVCADPAIQRLERAPVGFIKSIVVAPAARGRGAARSLIAAGMQALADHGAQGYYSLAWVNQRAGCQLCGALAALGFRSAQRIERFWYQDSVARGYQCPACAGPCECAVEVMLR